MARITVGSLVRHRALGATGLVVEHKMWNADWGAFGVQFNKPVNKGPVKNLTYLIDRADRWVLVNGCDNP